MIILSIYDPNVLQVEAFRLVAEGKFQEALAALDTAVAESEGKNPALLTVDPKIASSLQRLKPVFMLESGMSAARNNRGVVRFLMGNLKGAQEDLDYAAVASPETPIPWVNATLVLLAQTRTQQAEKSAQGALLRGADHARSRAVMAEVNLALGRISLAREDAERAVRLSIEDPYALLVQSHALRASGRSQEADRSLLQSLSLEPRAAVGSPLAPVTGTINGLGGNASEQHGAVVASGPSFRFQGHRLQQEVEGRSTAGQTDEYAEGTFGSPEGGWAGFASYHRSAGGRPGATSAQFGVDPSTQAQFRLDQQKVSLVRRDRNLAFHVGYHDDAVVLQQDPASPTVWPIQDQRMVAEGRWLSQYLQAGVSWSQNRRRQQGSGLTFYTKSPVEPAEQVLPGGRWAQSVAWAFGNHEFNKHVSVTGGPVAVQTRRAVVVTPFVDVALKGLTSRPSHFRIRPRVAEAGGDFFPEAARGATPQENNIDRHEETGQSINRTPVLAGPEGRIVESSFSLPLRRGKAELETTAFHRRMDNIFTQAADPRIATGLVLTPVAHAEATGLDQQLRLPIVPGLMGRVQVRYQEAYGRVQTLTQDGNTRNAKTRGLSNFPHWQASARLDATQGPWSVGSELQVVGKRPVWVTTVDGLTAPPTTFLSQSKETVGVNLFVKRDISHLGVFSLSVFNLTAASFYPGYPGTVTGVTGFAWRF